MQLFAPGRKKTLTVNESAAKTWYVSGRRIALRFADSKIRRAGCRIIVKEFIVQGIGFFGVTLFILHRADRSWLHCGEDGKGRRGGVEEEQEVTFGEYTRAAEELIETTGLCVLGASFIL